MVARGKDQKFDKILKNHVKNVKKRQKRQKTSKTEYKYGSKFLSIEMALTFYLPFDCKIIKKKSLLVEGPCC
jgi:hypothetical protein